MQVCSVPSPYPYTLSLFSLSLSLLSIFVSLSLARSLARSLQAFHAYEGGNLNWNAAFEVEAATLAITLRYWPNEVSYSIKRMMLFIGTQFSNLYT